VAVDKGVESVWEKMEALKVLLKYLEFVEVAQVCFTLYYFGGEGLRASFVLFPRRELCLVVLDQVSVWYAGFGL